jgi:hypothetical protein
MLCLLAGWPSLAAPPQTVYRCGPEGRVYSQTPCSDGRPVTTDNSRSASQQNAAKEVAARDTNHTAAGVKSPVAREASSAPARKAKAKLPVEDTKMSPPMRPAPAAAMK